MPVDPKERRAARHAQPPIPAEAHERRSAPITADRVVDAALGVIASKGYEAMTMRSVASVLDTGPASLYAHVVNKADLDELIIARLCTQLRIPTADPTGWRDQFLDVCAQLRDQYLRYPGISYAALAIVPTNLDVLALNEGLLAILLAGGIEPQTAAWAIDAIVLYVAAYTLEISLLQQRQSQDDGGWVVTRDDREEVRRRLVALPAERFPTVRRYAAELTAGSGHDRFDFTLGIMLDNLSARSSD